MSNEQQPSGFFNRASVVLFLVFMIPATLTIAGMIYVVMQGRVPGGEDSYCETMLDEDTYLRIEIYAYTAGLVDFETQTFLVSDDNETWQDLFADTIPVPQAVSCESSFTRLDENNYVLQNQKTIAWSSDSGATWQVHNVCDAPRPSEGRCEPETLNYVEIDLHADGNGTLLVYESSVNDFEQPLQDENGNPIIDHQWQLQTEDAGQTWSIQVLE